MTSPLASIRKGRQIAPPKVLLYGVPGIGKTTFAAQSKDCIFVPTEDGVNNLDTSSFPVARTFEEFMANLWSLWKEPHDYKAVAIDSLDWLEKLVWQYTVKQAHDTKIQSIEDFGYGKGYGEALRVWSQVLDLLTNLRTERGLPVILIAHCEIKRFDSPETDPYDRYQPKMHKTASAYVMEWCDAVLFTNYKAFTAEAKVGFNKSVRRAVGSGERVMYTSERPAYIAKNRYALPHELPLSWDSFTNAVAAFAATGNTEAKKD